MVCSNEPQMIGAAALHEPQIVGVVHDAGKIGVFVIYAHAHDVAVVAQCAIEVRATHCELAADAAERKCARSDIQISAMITPGMVWLSRRTRCTMGRSPVASKADRASSFCSNFARQARRMSCQCSHVPTGISFSL